jgi:hypothetical protein
MKAVMPSIHEILFFAVAAVADGGRLALFGALGPRALDLDKE